MAAATSTRPASPTTEGRDRVLRHAQALFVDRGFDGVSMQQIATAAGMTKAALYYHFRDKEELFGFVVRQEMERVRLALTAVTREEGSLRDHLERVARLSFGWFQSDFGRLMGDLKTHVSEQSRRAIGCDLRPPVDVVRERFDQAVADGEVREGLDLDLVVSLFFGMLYSQMSRARLQGAAPPDEETAATIVDVLLDGVGTTLRP